MSSSPYLVLVNRVWLSDVQTMGSSNLRIDIKARSSRSLPQTSQDAAKASRLEWTMDVDVSGTKTVRDITLIDPLDAKQRDLVRWYLEEYVQKRPYSVDPGKDATVLLEAYSKRLWQNLQLSELLSTCSMKTPQTPSLDTLRIRVSDDGSFVNDPGTTIHQLLWETLEDLDISTTSGLKVVVERHLQSVDSSGVFLAKPMRLWRELQSSGRTINILLVIGRDTSSDTEKYNDVRPFLAWEALSGVQKKLNTIGACLNLHVEIARPGTFASFEEHLRRAKETHGSGHFQMVHFDLHGKVGMSKGNKVGVLSFSREGSPGTSPVLASDVARVLKEYEVPFVVMNACESARATSGEDANIAGVLQRQGGVRNVLAMSFKISSAAVESFFTTFYDSLLVDRLELAIAVRKARQVLRADVVRPARFGVQRELIDSFVPVLYGPGDDSLLDQNDCREDATPTLPSRAAEQFSSSRGPIGRDFDILRLEKVLCESSSLVYLHGPTGVGKTAVLRYASRLWRQTRFVDAVVKIDLATHVSMAATDLANNILNQLLQTQAQAVGSCLWTIPSRRMQSHSLDAIKDTIASVLCSCRAAFLIDGLDMLSSPFRAPLASNASHAGPVTLGLFELINSLIVPFAARQSRCGSFFILAARRLDHEWLRRLSGPASNIHSFQLQPLQLADSMELSQDILRSAGEDISKWEFQDLDWLEATINLLQGIPMALKEIIPIQRALSIPWRKFYGQLHSGLFNSLSAFRDIGPYPLLQELCYLSSALPRDVFIYLMLFSCYWGQSAPVGSLERLFLAAMNKEVSSSEQQEPAPEHFAQWSGPILLFAADRGYIRIGLDSDIIWVHPLFTVYARAFVPKFNPHSQHPWMQEIVLKSIQLFPLQWEKLNTTPSGDVGDDEQTPKAIRYGGDANVLTSIKLCLKLSSRVPIDQWPAQLLHFYLMDNEVPIHMGQPCLDFLALCVGWLQTARDLRVSLLALCIGVIAGLLSSSRLSLWVRGQAPVLVHLGSTLLQSLDQCTLHGLSSEATILKAMLVLLMGKWQESHRTEDTGFDMVEMARNLKDDIHNNRQEIIQAMTSTSIYGTGMEDRDHHSTIELLIQDLDMLIHPTEQANTHESEVNMPEDRIFKSIQARYAPYIVGPGRAETEKASQLSPLETKVDVPSKDKGLSGVLQQLEDAIDTGDWTEAHYYHWNFFKDAVDKLLFDEADQHLKALRHICTMTGTIDILSPMLDELIELVDQQRAHLQFSLSLFPPSSPDGRRRKGTIQIHKDMLSSMNEVAPLHAHLAQTLCDRVAEKQGGGSDGYLPMISRESMLRHMRRYPKLFTDRNARAAMTRTLEEFLARVTAAQSALAENEFSTCFAELDGIEQMFRDHDWLGSLFEDSDGLEKIRQACTGTELLVNRLSDQTDAAAEGDFGRAFSIIDELSATYMESDNGSAEWAATTAIPLLRSATELESLAHEILTAKDENNHQRVQNLHTKYLTTWKHLKPKFDLATPQDRVESFIAETHNWLLEHLLATNQWRTGLDLCDSAIEHYTFTGADFSFYDIDIRRHEAALGHGLLVAAEAAADFPACLEALGRLEQIWRRQEQALKRPGEMQEILVGLSEKVLGFLRGCYRDECSACVRWVRGRGTGDLACRFEGRGEDVELELQGQEEAIGPRTGRHARAVFNVGTGCEHSCEGYCFHD